MRRRELPDKQRIALTRAATRHRRLQERVQQQLRASENELVRLVAQAAADGAGVRAIAEAIERSAGDTHRLITLGREAA